MQFGSLLIPDSSMNTHEIASTWTPPDIVFNSDFETGDSSEWNEFVTDSGNLVVAEAAALNSTDYGLSVTLPGGTTTSKTFSKGAISLIGDDFFRFRIYIDPNSVTLNAGVAFLLLKNNGSGLGLIAMKLGYSGGNYTIQGIYYGESGGGFGTEQVITDAPHYVEVAITRASGDGISDGTYTLWIDGTQKETVTTIGNYNRFDLMTTIYVGAIYGVTTGCSGTYYLDEFVSNRSGDAIGA